MDTSQETPFLPPCLEVSPSLPCYMLIKSQLLFVWLSCLLTLTLFLGTKARVRKRLTFSLSPGALTYVAVVYTTNVVVVEGNLIKIVECKLILRCSKLRVRVSLMMYQGAC